MRRFLIIHPFLFAVFPVLAVYSHNMRELSFSEVFVPFAIALGLALLLLLIIWLILRDPVKAGVLATIFLILFFSFGHVMNWVRSWGIDNFYLGGVLVGTDQRYLILIWLIISGISAYKVLKTKRNLLNTTKVLNVISVSTVLVSSLNIAAYEFTRPDTSPESSLSVSAPVQIEGETPPDIYYIILDAYGRDSTLQEYYGYDNSYFLDYLTDNGFYIASQSRCNYFPSGQSISSSLNVEYIPGLFNKVLETGDKRLLYDKLENNKVQEFLRSRGYKYIHVGSYWEISRENVNASQNIFPGLHSEFQRLFWSTTALYILPSIPNLPISDDYRITHWKAALFQFEKLSEVPDMRQNDEEPYFVFAHVVVPHVPHVFDQDGKFLPEEPEDVIEGYLNQLTYCNKRITEVVEKILAESEVPPIIILQGDHGPAAPGLSDCFGREDQFKITMRQLNAYHLPQGRNTLLYDSITPVNTFRLVFNYYFGTDYELLDDRSYWPNTETRKYDDITDIVK